VSSLVLYHYPSLEVHTNRGCTYTGGPAEQDNYLKQTGGKAGIWQGGMGLAVNGNNVYFVTGYV
jgi:hypothetical protein